MDAIQEELTDKTAESHMASGAFAMGDPDTAVNLVKKYQELPLPAFYGEDAENVVFTDGETYYVS